MLVSFNVENWTCFRDRQQFSMEATGRTPDELAFDTNVNRYPRLNRVSAIYGPNGSGKSRFVDALAFARRLVLESAQGAQAGDSIDTRPFLFDIETRTEPCRFDFVFIEGGVAYEYSFAVDSERIRGEWLCVRQPGGRRRRWLIREYHPHTKAYSWVFGGSFRGARSTWQEATRENALFVSTAVQLNSTSLRPIVNWFRNLAIVGPGGVSPDFTSISLQEEPEFQTRLVQFLKQADILVSEIRVQEQEIDPDEIRPYLPAKILENIEDLEGAKIRMPEFGLPVKGGDDLAYLELDEQSDGTQRVYSFAGPWLDVVDRSRVVVVDELDRSLHPHLVQFLIRFINRPRAASRNRAQLVATVHDTLLLEDALDRTQVWFTEKGLDQAATLTPLSSYRPRKNESLRRGYLGGRYGAIPNVAEFETIE